MNEEQREQLEELVEKVHSNSVVKSAILAKQRVANIVLRTRRIASLIGKLATLLISPVGLLVILGIIVLYLVFSLSRVVGPPELKDYCTDFGVPVVENIDDEMRSGAVIGYLSNSEFISDFSAAFVVNISGGNSIDFGKSSGIPEGCDTECLSQMEDLSGIALGAFRLKGDNAKQLINMAIRDGVEWTNSSTQLEVVKNILINAGVKPNSDIGDERDKLGAVSECADALGISMNRRQKTAAVSDTKKLLLDSEVNIFGCVSMGHGGNRSRLEGGSAIDSGLNSLDMSGMIAFLESFCSPTKFATPGNNGASLATGSMKEAKLLAEERGGEDPLDRELYSSCDRLVATAYKAMEADISIPWGAVEHQRDYFVANPDKYQMLANNSDCQSGDIIVWPDTHIAIYGVNDAGDPMIYQASYFDYLPLKMRLGNCNPTIGGDRVEYWRYIGD